MFTLDSVACTDTMPSDGQAGGAQLIAQNGSNGGFFSVAANDVYASLGFLQAKGLSITWTPEVHVGIGNGVLQRGTYGIRFRNYTPGAVAIVSAGLSEPAEPSLQLTAGGLSTPTSTSVMQVIQDQRLAVDAAAVTFSSLPQTYAHLLLKVMCRRNAPGVAAVNMVFNADVAANYRWQAVYGQGAAAAGLWDGGAAAAAITIGYMTGNDDASTAALDIDIPDYVGPGGSFYHSCVSKFACVGASFLTGTSGGVWRSNNAITRLDLLAAAGQFAAGSRFTLYGLTPS